MARIPKNVAAQKAKNEVARFVNGEWVFYRRTSIYDKLTGKSIPELVPVAVATPGGRIPFQKHEAANVTEFENYEFGYSYTLKKLIPRHWMTSLKGSGDDIFLELLNRTSPESYMLRGKNIHLPEDRNVDLQIEKFWHKLERTITRDELEHLKAIRMITIDGNTIIQKPTGEQQKTLDSLSIKLEGTVTL